VETNVPSSDPLCGRVELQPFLQQILSRVRREHFETWFRSLLLVSVDERQVEFSVTSHFVRDWLTKNFFTAIQEAVTAVAGGSRRVTLSLREEDGWDNNPIAAGIVAGGMLGNGMHSNGMLAGGLSNGTGMVGSIAPTPAPAPAQTVGPMNAHSAPVGNDTGRGHNHGAGALSRPLLVSQLNPNYTFDKFVVGPCNRLAHASALAIGENPGCAYNPLFVHGNVGLGKTHLLQAICQTVMRRDAKARVLYLSCEEFTNKFIQAIQNGALDEFRNYHRGVDVLVIDDIQFLANKEKTQDEFFHTFNALYDAQKQIVLSSDRPPVEIPTVEERLVSRFKWGLVAEVDAPCLQTREAIVRRKAKARGIDLADDVVAFVAERIATNIRELEGAVIKVLGIAAITMRPITRELAEEALRGIIRAPANQVSVDDVMTLITSEFAISARDLTGKSRTQAVSLPRQIAMFLVRDHTELSLEDIGRFFGNRDHTTVLYAVTKIRDRSQKDRMFKELLDSLSNRLVVRGHR
jgi:chromosomal replication initiator protein